uniref:FA_desaturase domain-containing protein n=1 Tax=Rhabditophanes sp. KR3021 TaxID=114890 RepID=A0AC35U4G9_9BILA
MASQTTTRTTVISKQKVQAPNAKYPTVDDIRKAIPEECFEKNLLKSTFYLVLDFAILACLYVIVPYVEAYAGVAGLLVWYWVFGMYASSLFCVGHDCGHGTYSEYTWVNDMVGHIAHAPILAPYWPWQKSHRQHHTYTSHVDKDTGHPWTLEEEYNEKNWFLKNFAKIPLSGLVRWNPIYTMVGLPDGSHFWPGSKLFTNTTERIQCVVSALACLFCCGVAFWAVDYSVYNWFKYYYVPCLFQGLWLVIITYLQHNFETIEVYEEGTWNYVKGQLQTIDRTYGFGIDSALHHITDGHVAHHFFFTKVPHYSLMKATAAIQQLFKPYPGHYKSKKNYDFVLEYLHLNVILEYMTGKGSGVLRYANADAAKTPY